MKKILIVEDEENIFNMYKFKFERHGGYRVLIADNGETGLELAKKEKPDLILLDLVLPHIDGYTVLRRLKENPETKDLKVFIISNLGRGCKTDDDDVCAKADGYLIKSSITPTQLVQTVDDFFNGKDPKIALPSFDSAKRTPDKEIPNTGKVLLIEDEDVLAEMYKLSLAKSGFGIDVARNGAWGIKLAGDEKFDIIVMDMLMPAMQGREAIEKLKADEITKNIPIIVLSNSAQDEDIDQAKALGVAAYLLKAHTTPSKLVAEIKKVLKIF